MSQTAVVITKSLGLVFITTSMLSAGFRVRPREAASYLRRPRVVGAAMAANFLVAPLIAMLIAWLVPIDEDYKAGLVLVAGCAGAPFLPTIAERARANIGFAITMMVLLVISTVAFVPVVMPRLLTGLTADPFRIAFPLIALIVLPLAAGMLVQQLRPAAAARFQPVTHRVADLSLVALLVVILATHVGALIGVIGTGAIFVAMLFSFLIGVAAYLLGYGADVPTRRVLALGSTQRNIAAALVVAGSSYADRPKVTVMILVMDVVTLAMLFAAARRFRRLSERSERADTPALAPESAAQTAPGPSATAGASHD